MGQEKLFVRCGVPAFLPTEGSQLRSHQSSGKVSLGCLECLGHRGHDPVAVHHVGLNRVVLADFEAGTHQVQPPGSACRVCESLGRHGADAGLGMKIFTFEHMMD